MLYYKGTRPEHLATLLRTVEVGCPALAGISDYAGEIWRMADEESTDDMCYEYLGIHLRNNPGNPYLRFRETLITDLLPVAHRPSPLSYPVHSALDGHSIEFGDDRAGGAACVLKRISTGWWMSVEPADMACGTDGPLLYEFYERPYRELTAAQCNGDTVLHENEMYPLQLTGKSLGYDPRGATNEPEVAEMIGVMLGMATAQENVDED